MDSLRPPFKYHRLSPRPAKDMGAFIDTGEPDFTLRCINWCVDLYLFTDQPHKALLSKWSRVNYLLGVC